MKTFNKNVSTKVSKKHLINSDKFDYISHEQEKPSDKNKKKKFY